MFGSMAAASNQVLKPCRLSPEDLGAPLAFDLYNADGMLLSRQGSPLSRGALAAQPLFRAVPPSERGEAAALLRLEQLFAQYAGQMERWACRREAVHDLRQLAAALADLCRSHGELCVCMSGYLGGSSHALRHSFASALIAVVLANALRWESGRQDILARAALTMNIALLSQHDDWARLRAPLSPPQAANVFNHPYLSADLLLQSPGVDLRWLAAVDQHHENLDGSGYPNGLKGAAIVAEARLLRVADSWCALLFQRAGRPRRTPQEALRELNGQAIGKLDHLIFVTLKKMLGPYPPGTLVRLASRETALILRWPRRGAAAGAAARIVTPSGQVSGAPGACLPGAAPWAIRGYGELNPAQLAKIPWARIWAGL